MHIVDKIIFNERVATYDVTREVNIDTVCHTLSFLATKPTRAVDRPLSFNMQRLFTEIKKKSMQDAVIYNFQRRKKNTPLFKQHTTKAINQ